jgi:tripartite-type tricarboxylate transporter receptor subunit TctC
VLGGQVEMMFDAVTVMNEHVKAGKVRALATSGKARSSVMPDVPTLAEAGVPGVEMSTWYGFFGPANLPREITARLHAETMKILAMPDVKKRLEGLAGEPGALSAGEFAAMAKSDYERSGKLVRDAGIKGEQ